ncbi:hypothetical protein AMAG_18384 [Allomyces macrogynus ATCC 38327]|uniref:Uncharacterized protein n=1 Tax=Allomyces macrogynus (strain ATCC 38327) TaxID=578462 RepID=A0A0L0S712_ALLM3|nr:hypothetical protein AMAG_18384 [Allomyces macrogynus ATCC 38327]|eukprot:KNE58186.1 hypothetical protein AMAG_18384 [Allomyces macrogynus ATCC 38327]
MRAARHPPVRLAELGHDRDQDRDQDRDHVIFIIQAPARSNHGRPDPTPSAPPTQFAEGGYARVPAAPPMMPSVDPSLPTAPAPAPAPATVGLLTVPLSQASSLERARSGDAAPGTTPATVRLV